MASSRRRKTPKPTRLILDAGAILAIASGDERARAFVRAASDDGLRVSVPAGAIAETVRGNGPRDALVNRCLKMVDDVPPVTEAIARKAGALLGRLKSDATLDALVVAEAASAQPAIILTGDPDDISALIAGEQFVRMARI